MNLLVDRIEWPDGTFTPMTPSDWEREAWMLDGWRLGLLDPSLLVRRLPKGWDAGSVAEACRNHAKALRERLRAEAL